MPPSVDTASVCKCDACNERYGHVLSRMLNLEHHGVSSDTHAIIYGDMMLVHQDLVELLELRTMWAEICQQFAADLPA